MWGNLLNPPSSGAFSPQNVEMIHERPDKLLQRNREEELSSTKKRELDRLLEHIDYMNKVRAIYTLQQL